MEDLSARATVVSTLENTTRRAGTPDITGVRRREIHKRRRDLDGLTRSTHRHGSAKLLDRLLAHGRWAVRDGPFNSLNNGVESSTHAHQRGPDGTGRDSIASDILVADDLVAQGAHEAHHGAFRRGIVDELGMADCHVDGCVERDGSAFLHVRNGSLRVGNCQTDACIAGIRAHGDGPCKDKRKSVCWFRKPRAIVP